MGLLRQPTSDITKGVIWKQLLAFFFPLWFGTFFQQLYNTVDTLVVGRFVGKVALAAVGSTSVIVNLTVGIFTGLAIGMGTSWFYLVTAEMISGQWGLGYYTWASYNIQNYDEVVVGMLLIGLFGMGSSGLVKRVGASLTPWYAAGGKVR